MNAAHKPNPFVESGPPSENDAIEDTMADRRSEEVTQVNEAEMPDASQSTEEVVELLTDFESSEPGADVRIYRVIEGVRSPGFVFHFPVGSKTYMGMVSELQRRYPEGGDFMMNVLSPHGRHPFLARRRFRLEPSPKAPGMEDTGGMVGLVGDLLKRMDDRFTGMMEQLNQREDQLRMQLTSQNQNQMNPLELLRGLAETLKAITPAPAPVAPGRDFGEMTEMMQFYRELREEARSEVAPDNESFGTTLLKALPKLAEILPALRLGQPLALAAPPPAAPRDDAATPILPETGASLSQESVTVNTADLATLVPYLELLNAQAKADNDPSVYAALIVDHTRPDDLKRLLSLPDLQAQIEAAYPAAIPTRAWWNELLDCVREDVNGDNPASDPES